MHDHSTRNKYFFGIGTIGRDMLYTLVSMYFLTYVTEALSLSVSEFALLGTVLTFMRIFDALNDPIAGFIVDNTKSRFGKFKPWIAIGAIGGGVFTVLMFADFKLTGSSFVWYIAVVYLLWDIMYGLNDIAYWSFLPALTRDQKKREKMGAFARICANIGMYVVVVGLFPLTEAFGGYTNQRSWFILSIAVCVMLLLFQAFTVFGVKEENRFAVVEDKTTLRDMFKILFGNDQLMWTALSMALFMVGYCSTTSFGTYFFIYAYGDESMYMVFAAVLGVAQLSALFLFPLFSKRFDRKKLYTFATILVVLGYLLFFVSPMNMIPIGIAGVLLFVGQAFIQLLMLMFLSDTVEYGQWRTGRRNESIILSVQPFINKIGGALATGVVTVTLIISGIKAMNGDASLVTPQSILIMKLAMMIMPLIMIVLGYIIYLRKYKIDKKLYDQMIAEIDAREQKNV